MSNPVDVYANAAAVATSKYDHVLSFGRIEEPGKAVVNARITLPAEFFGEFKDMVLEAHKASVEEKNPPEAPAED